MGFYQGDKTAPVLFPVCPESQGDYENKQQSAFGGKTDK